MSRKPGRSTGSTKEPSKTKRIVIDVDGTLCKTKDEGTSYSEAKPDVDIIKKMREYKVRGFTIVLYTSRQMRTHESNLGRIVADTVPVLLKWLEKHEVPYDEIHVGKPWCGSEGFYVDDKAIRPDEFLCLEYEKIRRLLEPGGRSS